MSASTTATGRTRHAGKRVEPGRYLTAHGERILIGQRVFGLVRVSDIPASGRGRRSLVVRELTCKAEPDALVADYLDDAWVHADCPMRVAVLDPLESSR